MCGLMHIQMVFRPSGRAPFVCLFSASVVRSPPTRPMLAYTYPVRASSHCACAIRLPVVRDSRHNAHTYAPLRGHASSVLCHVSERFSHGEACADFYISRLCLMRCAGAIRLPAVSGSGTLNSDEAYAGLYICCSCYVPLCVRHSSLLCPPVVGISRRKSRTHIRTTTLSCFVGVLPRHSYPLTRRGV